MERVIKIRNKNTISPKKILPVQPVEARLRIFANLIVDQLLDEQKNGKLGQIQQGAYG